jgi:hypothetical protein
LAKLRFDFRSIPARIQWNIKRFAAKWGLLTGSLNSFKFLGIDIRLALLPALPIARSELFQYCFLGEEICVATTSAD